jgi:hypothetical protein
LTRCATSLITKVDAGGAVGVAKASFEAALEPSALVARTTQ